MYEKQQNADSDNEVGPKVDVGETLQREYDLKHPPKDHTKSEILTLLNFSNSQIKKLNQELIRLKSSQAQDRDANPQ